MKKGLLVLLSVLVVTCMFAFEQGTINPGGTVSFSSYKHATDPTYKPSSTTNITFAPQIGYFVIENLCADLSLTIGSRSQGKSDYNNENSNSHLGIGIGGRYFYNNFYGGLGLKYVSNSDSWTSSAGVKSDGGYNGTYLDLKAGYLVPIVENVFVDLGLKYNMGFGSYGGEDYKNTPDDYKKNNEGDISFGAGLQVFFPIK
jgi:hypothetical protein